MTKNSTVTHLWPSLKFGNFLINKCPRFFFFHAFFLPLNFIVINPKHLLQTTTLLKKHSLFSYTMLLDISARHFPLNKTFKYCLTYSVRSLLNSTTLHIITPVKNILNSLESLNLLYNASAWLEREVFDMFGIIFLKNKDLRRILTDYGYEHFPLLKDSPVIGVSELFYNDATANFINVTLKKKKKSYQNVKASSIKLNNNLNVL